MVRFTTIILKFDSKGEKTGWSYIEIPVGVAQQLKKGNKKSFRVKGKLDNHPIKRVALMPMGDGNFIMAINSEMRKGIGKREGAMLEVRIEEDKSAFVIDKELMICLADEPQAISNFKKLAPSHQNYFSKWVASAKSKDTKAKRIAQTINAMLRKMNYAEMLREGKQ